MRHNQLRAVQYIIFICRPRQYEYGTEGFLFGKTIWYLNYAIRGGWFQKTHYKTVISGSGSWIGISWFEVLDVWRLLLYLGRPLWKSREKKIAIFDQKNIIFSCKFFLVFGYKSPDWYLAHNAGSGSKINESGSETLLQSHTVHTVPVWQILITVVSNYWIFSLRKEEIHFSMLYIYWSTDVCGYVRMYTFCTVH